MNNWKPNNKVLMKCVVKELVSKQYFGAVSPSLSTSGK